MWAKLNIKWWEIYNNLIIIEEIKSKIDNQWRIIRKFRCKCKCWNIIETYLKNIRNWHIKSCWCIWKQNRSISMKKNMTKHWMKWTKIYWVFDSIKSRCNNKNNINYKNYGARWIKCDWNSFEEFYEDMKEWYKSNLQIDRIDNNWNYNKQNCRWITAKENNRNRRNTIKYKWISLWESLRRARWQTRIHILYHEFFTVWFCRSCKWTLVWY